MYAREGVRDLNFRRSNVRTTEEEKEGHEEEDEGTGKRDTRGLHLAEFHARADRNENKIGNLARGAFSPCFLVHPRHVNLELVLSRLILVCI